MAQGVQLAPRISSLLSSLRWQIRAYIWIEGLSLAVIWLGLTFWAVLAIDYLPVLAGASEMPVAARVLVMMGVLGVLVYILYRWILRRTFVRLADRSMALLLERRYRDLGDSLVTTVELAEQPDQSEDFSSEMLENTSTEAMNAVTGVRSGAVINYPALVLKMVGAAVLAASVGIFCALMFHHYPDAYRAMFNRLVLLQDEPYPRRTHLEIVGIELKRQHAEIFPVAYERKRSFTDRAIKVAKGASFALRVRASAAADMVVPETCTIYYETEEGDSGSVNMKRIGQASEGFQMYLHDGKPFRGILSSIRFDVVGFDYRLRDYRIAVVDSPAVLKPVVHCKFPDYMVDEELSQWLPREIDLVGGTQLPRGTQLKIVAESNKELKNVWFFDPKAKEKDKAKGEGNSAAGSAIKPVINDANRKQFTYTVPSLNANLTRDVILQDVDGVVMDRPHRLLIAVVEDQPPKVDVIFRGISTVVTPDVLLPAEGTVTDDYAVKRTWFNIQVNDLDAEQVPCEIDGEKIDGASVDFRQKRNEEDLVLKPGDRLLISVKAEDKYDLGDEPNVGEGDRYQLEVVTPDELLTSLEKREIALRRRFEQIVDEMTETRESLVRVQTPVDAGAEPEDNAGGTEPDDRPVDPETERRRMRSLQLLRVQQASLQSQKSAQEVLGVAGSFDDIRVELINNRVDTEDRKKRLKELISEPLVRIGKEMFPRLDERLDGLETVLRGEDDPAEDVALVVEQTNLILDEMDRVLNQMVDLETYKELLAIVRSIIEEQEEIIKETEALKEDDPFGGF